MRTYPRPRMATHRPRNSSWMFANHELDIRTLRLGVHTHDAAAVTAAAPVCIVAVPVAVRDEHLAEEELVPLLVCPRALSGQIDVETTPISRDRS
jgi:hypothetical protein